MVPASSSPSISMPSMARSEIAHDMSAISASTRRCEDEVDPEDEAKARSVHGHLQLKKASSDLASWKEETARLTAEVTSLRSADFCDARNEGTLIETLQTAADCSDSKSPELTAGLIDCLGSYGRAMTKGAPKPKRQFAGVLKGFFGILLCYAGPRALGFVTKALGGPEVGTVKGWRQSEAPALQIGRGYETLVSNIDLVALPLMEALGIAGVSLVRKPSSKACSDPGILRRFMRLFPCVRWNKPPAPFRLGQRDVG